MKLPYFFIKAFIWITRIAEEIVTTVKSVYRYVRGYHRAHKWVYLHGQMLPLSHVQSGEEHAAWTYHDFVLTRDTSTPVFRMGWLSAKLISDRGEYDMDTFFERLRIRGGIPSLHVIFLAWCAETGHWFAPDQVTIHVIDEEGQDCTYRTDETLHAHGRRLYVTTEFDTVPTVIAGDKLQALFPSTDPYTFYHA